MDINPSLIVRINRIEIYFVCSKIGVIIFRIIGSCIGEKINTALIVGMNGIIIDIVILNADSEAAITIYIKPVLAI